MTSKSDNLRYKPVPVETTVWRVAEIDYKTEDEAFEAASLLELEDFLTANRDGIDDCDGMPYLCRDSLIRHASQLSRILDRVASNKGPTQ